MHIYDESTRQRSRWCFRINWSRELTFSERQINYIRSVVPDERGVYCIYSKDHKFSHEIDGKTRWSPIVYIGSGYLHKRLSRHLDRKENDDLATYLEKNELAYRYERIVQDVEFDGPRTVEAILLQDYADTFGGLPPANRRMETVPDLGIDELCVEEPDYFSVLIRN